MVAEEFHVQLPRLHLGLLEAEEIGVQCVESLFKAIFGAGSKPVHVPTNEFHIL
jgi:hypothetical protein